MADLWNSDEQLFTLARAELFTAVIGDIMDKLGFLHQFLPPRIQPLDREMILIGRAMPVLGADCLSDAPGSARQDSETADPSGGVRRSPANPALEKPFGLMLEALDDLLPNEVYLWTGGSPRYAGWGELMSTRAMKLQAAGAVIDGYARDTRGILGLGFPTFCYGSFAQDQAPRGKVVDFRCPVEIEGVRVDPGDIVFGDIDGVCVVPRKAETEVFVKALEKARGEKQVQQAIAGGMPAREAFERYGIM